MMRRRWKRSLAAAIMAGMMLCCMACVAQNKANGCDDVAKIEGKNFCLKSSNGVYAPAFLNGVNIGAAKAGYFPGEFGVTYNDYLRWFRYISEMNVDVIRVYVNQMPCFYDALLAYNQRTSHPLYLMQGVYVDETLMEQYMDPYAGGGALQESFLSDIRNAVDMIHGNATVPKLPGNAGGEYTSDVSRWVIGYILGIEWSADIVINTNTSNPQITDFDGKYVYTSGASPFEVFLAQSAEEAIAWETDRYGVQRPVALSNWCTTDPLEHPNEPNAEMEDAASVDVEHIRAKNSFSAGFFASYHVYPYYPDFMSYDTKYLQGDDPDPYLAYLEELNAYHTMPVLVTEYGIPTSRGIAHVNPVTGMSQGNASEEQQAEWLMKLNSDIREAGCAGGFIFCWQDEWFKRTWNSMDYEDPDRRPYWYDAQSPEEAFGLCAYESGKSAAIAKVDGSIKEWKKADVVIENEGIRVSAKQDAGYLYLMVEGECYDFEEDTLYLPLDVLAGCGNTHWGELSFDHGAEYLLRLHGRTDSELIVDAYYDVFQYDYSQRLDYFDPLPGQNEKDSGCFNTIWLAMNRPQYLPETNVHNPFERFHTGRLIYGNANPDAVDYLSLSDFCAGDGFVEIRLPWLLIGFRDPSQKLVIGSFNDLLAIESVRSEGIRIGVLRKGSAATAPMSLFTWDNWDIPVVHERLKKSYYLLRDYFAGLE